MLDSPAIRAPPTVPPARSGRAVRWPAAASSSWSAATGVPARTRTVISAGSKATMPAGA